MSTPPPASEELPATISPPRPMTAEQFVDHLSSQSLSSLCQLRHLSVTAYPFPLYSTPGSGSYVTYDFIDTLPLFPGLQLSLLEIEDAFHGSEVAEDGWGHNATYNTLKRLIQRGMGWRELRFRSASDCWLEPVTFRLVGGGQADTTKTHGRDTQPATWNQWIKARDGDGDGAGVEMWTKVSGEGKEWEKVEGDYVPTLVEKEEDNGEENRPAVEVRVRRGKHADYVQREPKDFGENNIEYMEKFYGLFKTMSWQEIKKKGLFMRGAEDDPTAHL